MQFSQLSRIPQIKDVIIGQTIGNGSFACVKSAHLEADPSAVFAIKFVHIPTCKESGLDEKEIIREAALHFKASKHPNVLKVLDCNLSGDFMWMMMEKAEGGDLFDKIEPDVGVDTEVAQFYFQQLIRALNYLHTECGIAHRDIKPENILLDNNGNLKLSDFGLASKFRRNDDSFRLSSDQRGSPPYMAPEILHSTEYYAQITDIWSAGILLFVLLTGEIPWEFPALEDSNFKCFVENDGNIDVGPWSKVRLTQLNLLRKLLQCDPENRISMEAIQKHIFFTTQVTFANELGLCEKPQILAQRLLFNLKVSLTDDDYSKSTQDVMNRLESIDDYRSTQPNFTDLAQIDENKNDLENLFHSQKALSQTTHCSVTAKKHIWKQLLSNDVALLQYCSGNEASKCSAIKLSSAALTKFYTFEEVSVILLTLENSLMLSGIKVKPNLYNHFEKITANAKSANLFPVFINLKTESISGRKLVGKVSIQIVGDGLKVVELIRKKGDPIEWRRLFKKIALFCRSIIFKPE